MGLEPAGVRVGTRIAFTVCPFGGGDFTVVLVQWSSQYVVLKVPLTVRREEMPSPADEHDATSSRAAKDKLRRTNISLRWIIGAVFRFAEHTFPDSPGRVKSQPPAMLEHVLRP